MFLVRGILLGVCVIACWVFFFFKQKTAYEMRISDWSSDVCSSDLRPSVQVRRCGGAADRQGRGGPARAGCDPGPRGREGCDPGGTGEIGRASCRERVCQYV